LLSAASDATRRASALGHLTLGRWADGVLFAGIAAGVFVSSRAYGAYEITVWAPLGLALVAVAAALLIGGRRIPMLVAVGALALVLLGAWSLLSTAWGGLPSQAWQRFDQFILAAAALVAGSALTSSPGRRALVASAVLAAVSVEAVEVLVRVALPSHPESWFYGRFLQGPVGYHNAQAILFAVAVPLGLWQANHGRLVARMGGAAAAVILVAAVLLTQSRGALVGLGVGLLVQLAWARSPRLLLLTGLLAGAGAGLWFALRGVDAALLEGTSAEQVDALRRYGGWAALAALALAGFAALSLPRLATRVVAAGLGAAVLAAVVVGASRGEVLPGSELTISGLSSDAAPDVAPAGETRIVSLSRNGRAEAWRVARLMTSEHPLMGAGQGQFARRWTVERRLPRLYVLQPHSLELELSSELGLVGLGLFAVFAAAAAAALMRTSRRPVAAAALGAGAALLTQASIDWTWSFPAIVAATLFVIGAAAGSRPRALMTRSATAALAIAVIGVIVSFGGPYLADRQLAQAANLQADHPDRAWQAAERARRLDPRNPDALALQGRLSEAAGQWRRAADRYDAAAQVSPRPWVEHYREARALARAGLVARSRAACRRAVRENPGEKTLFEGPCAHEVAGNTWPVVRTSPGDLAPGAKSYEGFFKDEGCVPCSLALDRSQLEATVAGGADSLDTAYAVRDFGGRRGASENITIHDTVDLAGDQALAGNLAVLQVRDVDDALVYEIYISDRDRTIRLWSPPGGLGATAINLSTDVALPKAGSDGRRIEVFAHANQSAVVRVDGKPRIKLGDLSGAKTSPQRYLRVGIVGYDDWSTYGNVRVVHRAVKVQDAP
jgi:tetratricopeptide (TPR) repeat protein